MLLYAVLLWCKPTPIFSITFLSLRSHWLKINDKYEVFCMHGLCCLRSRLLQKVVLPPSQLNWWEIVFVRTTPSPLVRREAWEYCVQALLKLLSKLYPLCFDLHFIVLQRRTAQEYCVQTIWLQIVCTTLSRLVTREARVYFVHALLKPSDCKLCPLCFDLYCIALQRRNSQEDCKTLQ